MKFVFKFFLFSFSFSAFSYVEFNCGQYEIVGHYSSQKIIIYKDSLSEKIIGNIFSRENVANIKKRGIPDGGMIFANVEILKIKEGYVQYGEVIEFRPLKPSEINLVDTDQAVKVINKKVCQK